MTQNQMVNITIELDKEVKESGEALFRSLGMNWSTAISALVNYSIKQGKIPFALDGELDDPLFSRETYEMDSYYDKEIQADLRMRMADIKTGRNLVDFDPTERTVKDAPKLNKDVILKFAKAFSVPVNV